MDMLPEVRPSSGPAAVFAGSMRTCAKSTSSSSAASCARAVRMPCPSSTLPTRTSTRPFVCTVTQRARTGFATRSLGSEGTLPLCPLMRPPLLR